MNVAHTPLNWSRRELLLLTLASATSIYTPTAYAQRIQKSSGSPAQKVRTLLQVPENQINYAHSKLTLDSLIDPSTNIETMAKRLDAMAQSILSMLPFARRLSSFDKAEALLKYVYDPGSWNKNQVFKYDLENNPTGTKNPKAPLLANYLDTRLGNCVSMPILFVVLAQKIGLEASLSTMPLHVFAKFRDEAGAYHNVEATTGGPKKDASYLRDFQVTKEALTNGLYLKSLTRKESVVVMAKEVVFSYLAKGDLANVHAVSEVLLEYDPKAAEIMVSKGSAYSAEFRQKIQSKYPTFKETPDDLKPKAKELLTQNKYWFDKAEALGWREETVQSRQAYEKMVRNVKKEQ
jgi:regulator of sirC expression with transglutaminase-like and TPR domain